MNQQNKTFIEWLQHLKYINSYYYRLEQIKNGLLIPTPQKPNLKPLKALDKRLIENGFLLS